MPIDKPDNPIAKIQALLKEKNKSKLSATQFWKPSGLINRVTPLIAIQQWLKTTTSLTEKLRHICPELEVMVLSETYETPMLSETQQLGLANNEKAWVRCVVLRCQQRHLIYARTVIPNMNPNNPWQELQDLGNKPLGEILFEMPSIQRSSFEFSKNKLQDWPHLNETIAQNEMNNTSFARRSVFVQKQAPLLLTEVFLPTLLNE